MTSATRKRVVIPRTTRLRVVLVDAIHGAVGVSMVVAAPAAGIAAQKRARQSGNRSKQHSTRILRNIVESPPDRHRVDHSKNQPDHAERDPVEPVVADNGFRCIGAGRFLRKPDASAWRLMLQSLLERALIHRRTFPSGIGTEIQRTGGFTLALSPLDLPANEVAG